MRWLPWAINHPTALVPPGVVIEQRPPRFCIVIAQGGQYGEARFPWVATLCGDEPKLSSPIYFGSRPPTERPERCLKCTELLAKQDAEEPLTMITAARVPTW